MEVRAEIFGGWTKAGICSETVGLSIDRIAMLSDILNANPEDTFARYGLAMEYSKAGQIEEALLEFKTLIDKNPDYAPGYFMAAQTLATASRVDEAKRWLAEIGRAHV